MAGLRGSGRPIRYWLRSPHETQQHRGTGSHRSNFFSFPLVQAAEESLVGPLQYSVLSTITLLPDPVDLVLPAGTGFSFDPFSLNLTVFQNGSPTAVLVKVNASAGNPGAFLTGFIDGGVTSANHTNLSLPVAGHNTTTAVFRVPANTSEGVYTGSIFATSLDDNRVEVVVLNVTVNNTNPVTAGVVNVTQASGNVTQGTNMTVQVNLTKPTNGTTTIIIYYCFTLQSANASCTNATAQESDIRTISSPLDFERSIQVPQSAGEYFFKIAVEYPGSAVVELASDTVTITAAAGPSSPGAGGGGGSGAAGGAAPPSQSREEALFTVSPDIFHIVMRLGSFTQEFLTIRNGALELDFTVDNTIGEFAVVEEDLFTLQPGATKNLFILFFAPQEKQPDTYVGTVVVKAGGSSVSIPVVIDIRPVEALLDTSISVLEEYRVSRPGEPLLAVIELINLGTSQKVADVNIRLEAMNVATRERTLFLEETLAFQTQLSIIRDLQLPESMPPGKYALILSVDLQGQKITASDFFEVAEPEEEGISLQILLLAGIVIVGAVVVVVFYHLHEERKAHREAGKSQKLIRRMEAYHRGEERPGPRRKRRRR